MRTWGPIGADAGELLAVAIGSEVGCTSCAGGGEHRCVTFFAAKLARHVAARFAREYLPPRVAS